MGALGVSSSARIAFPGTVVANPFMAAFAEFFLVEFSAHVGDDALSAIVTRLPAPAEDDVVRGLLPAEVAGAREYGGGSDVVSCLDLEPTLSTVKMSMAALWSLTE